METRGGGAFYLDGASEPYNCRRKARSVQQMRLASRGGSYSDMLFAVNASTPIEQKLAEALAECDRLQEENRQLRDRLGISSEQKPVQPTSTPSTNGASVINSKSSPDEKVKLFRDLFRGRDDVYAVRWEGRNGKTGYSPA